MLYRWHLHNVWFVQTLKWLEIKKYIYIKIIKKEKQQMLTFFKLEVKFLLFFFFHKNELNDYQRDNYVGTAVSISQLTEHKLLWY